MPPIVLENAALLDGTVNERRDGHHVVIEDDRIREVADTPVSLPLDDLNVLQEQGKYLSMIMKGGKIDKQTLG
jgi:hypothetical protein